MRHIVVLPDYDQSGSLSAWTEQGIRPLKQALSEAGVELSTLPPSFVIGIPEPVLKEYTEREFVLSQVIRLENVIIMSTSCLAGLDISGRHVFLTEIIIEENVEAGIFDLKSNYELRKIDAGEKISRMVASMREKAFNDMLSLMKLAMIRPRYKHLSSSKMIGMRYQPDWPKKKLTFFLFLGGRYLAILITLLVIVIAIYEYVEKGK